MSAVGTRIEGVVGPVAHGGHCVLRPESGPVVFVRHALPGERVVVEVTEGVDGDRFWRGDAVEVLEASPDRVEPPCPFAGPGRCGGCDWQHVEPAEQRRLKAAVVREQLARLAGLDDVAVTVEELPGGPLRWRSRARFAVDRQGAPGLRRHRSHDVVALLRDVNTRFGTTIVVVTHDPAVSETMDRTVSIRDGRIGAAGVGGEQFLVVGRDGGVQLPAELNDLLPPGSLLRAEPLDDGSAGVVLRRVDGDAAHKSDAYGRHRRPGS